MSGDKPSEERARAVKFRKENEAKFTAYKHHYVLNEGEDWDEEIIDEIGLFAAFAAEEVALAVAVAAERERCAKIADAAIGATRHEIAREIRGGR
jgi:hypothetical protein